MPVMQKPKQNKPADLKALGLKSPMEVIDILALLRIDGEPVIKDDKDLLDAKRKAKAVVEFYTSHFQIDPKDLPYLASLVKHDIKHGKITRGRI